MSFFPTYEALWRRIQGHGVWVHYDGLDTDEGGHFVHDGCGDQAKPEIQITRPFYREPMDEPSEMLGTGQPTDVNGELLTLAHEFGHYLSWRGETPRAAWNEYHAAVLKQDAVAGADDWDAVPKALSDREKQLIVGEEALAWKLGREFVPDELRAEYDEKARLGVHYQRYLRLTTI